MAGRKGDGKAPLIIRKIEVVEGGGHHGGAWKVAYADFVTAMMAFFLLMWLLNATTEQQRRGIADYFSPTNLMSHSSSGSGKPFGGLTPNEDAAMISTTGAVTVTPGSKTMPPDDTDDDTDFSSPRVAAKRDGNSVITPRAGATSSADAGMDAGAQPGGRQAKENAGFASRAVSLPNERTAAGQAAGTGALPAPGSPGTPGRIERIKADGGKIDDAAFQAELERRERAAFDAAAQQIREAIQADPALAELSRQLVIDMTPEGLRIQLIDEDKKPMFATGSSVPSDRAQALLMKVGPILARMTEQIAISGHTDASAYAGMGRTNWELSADRANATRRTLAEAGLAETRIRSVTGNADRDPLLPNDPMAPANRRIAIVVLRNTPLRTEGIGGAAGVTTAGAAAAAVQSGMAQAGMVQSGAASSPPAPLPVAAVPQGWPSAADAAHAPLRATPVPAPHP